jgi:hypothetical protein
MRGKRRVVAGNRVTLSIHRFPGRSMDLLSTLMEP